MSIELSALAPERQAAVSAWLAESIGDCVSCSGPIRRTEGHRAADGGFAHVDCTQAKVSVVPPLDEADSIAVEARGRRSDWG